MSIKLNMEDIFKVTQSLAMIENAEAFYSVHHENVPSI